MITSNKYINFHETHVRFSFQFLTLNHLMINMPWENVRKRISNMLFCITIHSFATIIIQSFSVGENVPTVWPHRQWSGLGSRPLPFDVAAVFVHQRQRSALSHSTICHLLNPSLWLGRSGIVCVLHQEVRNARSCSHLPSPVQSVEIRCDFSPAFKSCVGFIRQPAVSSVTLLISFWITEQSVCL